MLHLAYGLYLDGKTNAFSRVAKNILKFKKRRSITMTGGGIITTIKEPDFIQTGKNMSPG